MPVKPTLSRHPLPTFLLLVVAIALGGCASSPTTKVCARSGGAPIRTIDDALIVAGQKPGRQLMGMPLQNGVDFLIILVDDAPGLQQNQMRVELDINPDDGVIWNKAIEAWEFCQSGSRVNLVEASMLGGFGVGTICSPLTAANDMRSGCTNTQTMLLNQNTTSELWLRKPEFVGIWHDIEGLDSSIWSAFGGRSVRFIWMAN